MGPEYRRNEGFLRDPEGFYNGGKSPSSISCPLLGVTHITLSVWLQEKAQELEKRVS